MQPNRHACSPFGSLVILLSVGFPGLAVAQVDLVGSELEVAAGPAPSKGEPAVSNTANGDDIVRGEPVTPTPTSTLTPAPGVVPLGVELLINTYTTNVQFLPKVASAGNGDFVVVWASFGQYGFARGTYPRVSGVYLQRFAASGLPQGGELLVNTYTTGNQEAPDVSADSNGNFVVWQGIGEGGVSGVFGQLYSGQGERLGANFRIGPGSSPHVPVVSTAEQGSLFCMKS